MGAPCRRWLRPLLAACLAARLAAVCPRLCACYGPAEVHCTFRYFTAVPPRIAPDVERINLGYVRVGAVLVSRYRSALCEVITESSQL